MPHPAPSSRSTHASQHLATYGHLDMDVATNTADGTTTYKIRAPHARGHLVLVPGAAAPDPTEPARAWRPDLFVHFGTEHPTQLHRQDPLTVNGIALTGPSPVSFESLDNGSTVPTKRPDKNTNPVPLPPATARHAEAILGAVIAHWRTQPDRPALEDTARRTAAAHWLQQHTDDLNLRELELGRAQAARDKTLRKIQELQAIAAGPDNEHQA
ncbi:hypothetical protein [Streptomyces sp. NPDC051183]|uniref:hypothetical protein n=1 Tax=Streptomyces sp. NPDC051183 TaxID=3155165 RepID=UPI003413E5A7